MTNVPSRSTITTSKGSLPRLHEVREHSRPIIEKALDLGVNFFDIASVYSVEWNENIVGRTLKDFSWRDEVFIANEVR